MEKKRMMTAIKMYERNQPIAKIMLEEAGIRKEVAEEAGWTAKITEYMGYMQSYACEYADYFDDKETEQKYLLAKVYDDELAVVLYEDRSGKFGHKRLPMIIWQVTDYETIIGIPYFLDCGNCDKRCAASNCSPGKIIILKDSDLNSENWPTRRKDWELAESLGVFKCLPDNWDMAYRVCLADNEK